MTVVDQPRVALSGLRGLRATLDSFLPSPLHADREKTMGRQRDLLTQLEPAPTSLSRETLVPMLATLLLEALAAADTFRDQETDDEQDNG